MRVITGIAKGRKLASFKGSDIRPTSDRAKESLFNILREKVASSAFLDLFSGSGAMGIEAFSRGAKNVLFIENQSAAIGLIKKNLEKCGFSENAQYHIEQLRFSKSQNQRINIIQKDVLAYLKTARKKFDIIFIDPPYKTDLAEKSLLCLSKKNMLKHDGIIVLEQYFKNVIKEEFSGLQCFKRKRVGDSAFSFFYKINEKDEAKL